MERELQLTEEEYLEMDLLLEQALNGARVELHHTASYAYKERVKDRIRMLEGILARMKQVPVMHA